MLHRSLLAALAALAVLVEGTSVLIPLYSWDENCWPELQKAALPQICQPLASFIAILNPSSGPGDSDVEDPGLYCAPVLRQAIPNLVLLGYVRTGYGDRSASDVEADVHAYAGWADLSVSAGGAGGKPKLDGIFFDQSPSFVESADGLDTYIGYATTAREALGEGSTVMFNPGIFSSPKLYDAADYVVVYEDDYAFVTSADLPTDSSMQAKSALMLNNPPLSSSGLLDLVSSFASAYGALWIANDSAIDEDIYRNMWQEFVHDVASAGGGSSDNTSSGASPSSSSSSESSMASPSSDSSVTYASASTVKGLATSGPSTVGSTGSLPSMSADAPTATSVSTTVPRTTAAGSEGDSASPTSSASDSGDASQLPVLGLMCAVVVVLLLVITVVVLMRKHGQTAPQPKQGSRS